MASRIPVRQTSSRVPLTRPTAKKIENAVVKNSNPTAKSTFSSTTSAPDLLRRATAATASSKAKAVDESQAPGIGKRRREILGEVIVDRNAAKVPAKSKASVVKTRPARIAPTRDALRAETKHEPVFVPPPKRQAEEEPTRVFKKRHTDPPPPPSEDIVEAQLVAPCDDDEDISGLYEDIDAEDMDDPWMVAEYAAEITKLWKDLEGTHLPNPKYIDNHPELSWTHRGQLLNWIIEVHTICPFNAESFFLCVNILDRFCSLHSNISLKKYQLVGIACFLIASKFEEVVTPSVTRMLSWAGDQYTREDLIRAERYVLQVLGWDLSFNGPMGWLRRASRADGLDIRSRTIAKYLLEVGAFEVKLVAVPPSLIAAAALFLGRLSIGREQWTPNLIYYTTYRERELVHVASIMLTYIAKSEPPHPHLFTKFASKSYLKSSTFLREWTHHHWAPDSEVDLAESLSAIKAVIYEERIERLEKEQDNHFSDDD